MAVETLIGGTDRNEIEQYSSISWIAVCALLLAGLSFLALAHPVLWCLPVVAAMLALFGVQQIRGSDGALTGHGIALFALGLSLCAGSHTKPSFSGRLGHDMRCLCIAAGGTATSIQRRDCEAGDHHNCAVSCSANTCKRVGETGFRWTEWHFRLVDAAPLP